MNRKRRKQRRPKGYIVTVINSEGVQEREHVDLKRPWSAYVPPNTVLPNKDQPRSYFDETKMEQLGGSLDGIGNGSEKLSRRVFAEQVESVTVIPFKDPKKPNIRWKICNGERRWRNITIGKYKAILIAYRPGVTEDNLFETSFRANWCTAGHTHKESALAIERLRKKDMTYEQIAKLAGRESPAWAIMEHSLLRLHPKLLDLIDPPTPKEQRLPVRNALELVNLPHEEQLREYEKVKSLPKTEAYHQLRIATSAIPDQIKTGRPRVPSDDRRYVEGKIEKIDKEAGILTRLTPEFLDCFAGQGLANITLLLRTIRTNLDVIEKMLNVAAAKEPVKRDPTPPVPPPKRPRGRPRKVRTVPDEPTPMLPKRPREDPYEATIPPAPSSESEEMEELHAAEPEVETLPVERLSEIKAPVSNIPSPREEESGQRTGSFYNRPPVIPKVPERKPEPEAVWKPLFGAPPATTNLHSTYHPSRRRPVARQTVLTTETPFTSKDFPEVEFTTGELNEKSLKDFSG